jgi:O-methyltransferase involved in polyketide biosynthesis
MTAGNRAFDIDLASKRNLVLGQASRNVSQYVILRTGLDSFARSRTDIASRLTIFEVDRPEPQAWKRQRLIVRRVFGPPNRWVGVAGRTDGLRIAAT